MHDDERAKRFDCADIGRRRAGKAQARADISLDLAVAQRLRRFLGSELLDFDLVGIERGIDRKLVSTTRHGDDCRRSEDEESCSKPFHIEVSSPAAKYRKRAGHSGLTRAASA